MKIIKFLTVIFIFFLINTSKSFSLIEVDITSRNFNPLPIALSPLSQNDKSKKKTTKKLNPTRYGDWEIKGRCIDF